MLKFRREQGSALEMGPGRVMGDTSTGEMVELDPMRRLSVHEIYTKIAKNFETKGARKDAAKKAKALADLEVALGVEVHDADGSEVGANAEPVVVEQEELPDDKFQRLMHQLAEDIYDALEKAHKSIAIIKPESLGERITSHIDNPGDANFLVARGEGEHLLASLRSQDAAFRVLKHNSYGFVMENKELGFRALFIFQERITEDGELTAPEIEETEIEPKAATAKERTPEKIEGNVAGATTPKQERATVAKEDHAPDMTAQFAGRTQHGANVRPDLGQPASFGDAANVPPVEKAT
jgi:hypothetical protein